MIDEVARKRAIWRATHRGTKEADMLVGGFAERYLDSMSPEEFAWFERLLEEQDVDIMAWAFRKQEPPEAMRGAMMDRLMALDYVQLIPR